MKTNKLMIAQAKADIDSEVWGDLIKSYQPLIEKWVTRFDNVYNDVSDITQDVLCVLVTELPKFEHNGRTGAFRNWLRTITVNRIRQHWGRKKKHRTDDSTEAERALQQLADPSSELSNCWNQDHDLHIFQQALAKVEQEFDSKTTAVFRRFVLNDESADKIANDLGISTNQIYKYKFRFVRRLKEVARSYERLGLSSVANPFANNPVSFDNQHLKNDSESPHRKRA